jgi:Trm5-related predicted tRNA methylase
MAPVIPQQGKQGKIDAQDVRDFIFDRTLDDNPTELDLVFSDDEIQKAMRFAAMKYNETSPFVHEVSAAFLPFGSMFLNGIAYTLYLSKLQMETRQDIEYQAGSMTIDVYKRKVEHLQNFVKLFKTEFETMVKERKLAINISAAFHSF